MNYGVLLRNLVAHGRESRVRRPASRAAAGRAADWADGIGAIATGVAESEKARRHLAAIDSEGSLLWVRNPYEDKPAFCQYRTPRQLAEAIVLYKNGLADLREKSP